MIFSFKFYTSLNEMGRTERRIEMSEDEKETIKFVVVNGGLFVICCGLSVLAYKTQARYIAKEVVKLLPAVL